MEETEIFGIKAVGTRDLHLFRQQLNYLKHSGR